MKSSTNRVSGARLLFREDVLLNSLGRYQQPKEAQASQLGQQEPTHFHQYLLGLVRPGQVSQVLAPKTPVAIRVHKTDDATPPSAKRLPRFEVWGLARGR